MNFLKKSIACLVALGFMPSPRAAAEDWSYGIKVGGTTSFMFPDTEKQQQELKQLSGEASIWNPWFGASLYMEYAFNDYIGMDIELLYNRFVGSTLFDQQGTKKKVVTSIQTIGLPVLPGMELDCGYSTRLQRRVFPWSFFCGFVSFFLY